jgi:phenylpropionate dioxygenase-like ring-hydroxylating dioxygenase large terminal subunit
VRVLRNACRHQNMPVVGQPAGTCESFRCRFHGWTYDLQGKFMSAPPPVAPSDTTPGANDLPSLPVRVLNGLVFFAVDQVSTGFFPPEPAEPYSGTIVTDIACNWKVCLERLLGNQGTSEPEFAWFWPLLVVRRSGPVVLVEQVVPHTFPAHPAVHARVRRGGRGAEVLGRVHQGGVRARAGGACCWHAGGRQRAGRAVPPGSCARPIPAVRDRGRCCG